MDRMRSALSVIAGALLLGLTVSNNSSAEDDGSLIGSGASVPDILNAIDPPVMRGLEVEPARFGVTFELNSAELTPDAIILLNKLGKALSHERVSTREFSVVGHTDASGTEAHNQWLSERRANAVRNFLVSEHDVLPARLLPAGKGESELLLPNQPLAAENRRVDIKRVESRDG